MKAPAFARILGSALTAWFSLLPTASSWTSDRQPITRAEEFLASIAELMDAALAGHKEPESRCYVYDAQEIL